MPSKVYLAIPLMNEYQNLSILISDIESQDYKNFEVFFCVNQLDSWWENEEKKSICLNNQRSLKFLNTLDSKYTVIDRSSKGNGWDHKNFGVGWARKTIMDLIAVKANDHDIILTLDGDTHILPNYLSSVVDTLTKHENAVALSIPYYHQLTGEEEKDRNILRYEIYMRHYALNLYRIKNPYHFTAIGSAIAVPVRAYKRVRGITPHKSGEDFYFLLKLKKFGVILNWNPIKIYPEARYSDRVFFGTGPAMIKGKSGDWSSYPIYHADLFDEVEQSFRAFKELFDKDIDYPMKSFLRDVFKDEYWYLQLRKNNKKRDRFYKAVMDKVDALRILQYLKQAGKNRNGSDEENFLFFMRTFYSKDVSSILKSDFNFSSSSIEDLNKVRNYLVEKEEKFQQYAQ